MSEVTATEFVPTIKPFESLSPDEAEALAQAAHYAFEPKYDCLRPGSRLAPGMIALIEGQGFRQPRVMNAYEYERALANNRWAVVIEVIRHPDSDVLTFITEYEDGTQRARHFHSSSFWIVKKESL